MAVMVLKAGDHAISKFADSSSSCSPAGSIICYDQPPHCICGPSGLDQLEPLMKLLLPIFASLFLGSALAEDITLVAENAASEEGSSQTINLEQGESAKLLFISGGSNARLNCAVGGKTFDISCYKGGAGSPIEANPVVIAGPATVTFKIGGYGNSPSSAFATLSIARVGITSSSAGIPQEADTTWNVILESSSDLVNWLPVNPGEYTGTEARRFFRTRIVKKPLP